MQSKKLQIFLAAFLTSVLAGVLVGCAATVPPTPEPDCVTTMSSSAPEVRPGDTVNLTVQACSAKNLEITYVPSDLIQPPPDGKTVIDGAAFSFRAVSVTSEHVAFTFPEASQWKGKFVLAEEGVDLGTCADSCTLATATVDVLAP